MTDVRARRSGRGLEVAGVLRYQLPHCTDGQEDVEETAARLWRAREEASREALRLRLETSFAATETGHTRQWRRVLGGPRRPEEPALEGEHAYRTDMDRPVETLSAGRCPPAGGERRSRGRRLSPADGL